MQRRFVYRKTEKPCSAIADVATNLSNNPISTNECFYRWDKLAKTAVVRVESRNGEIHIVLADQTLNENGKTASDFDDAEIRRIMRNEVSKPLMLVRSE